jgi:hypothetical protein
MMRNLILAATPWRFRIAGRIRRAIGWAADRDPEIAEVLAVAGVRERC